MPMEPLRILYEDAHLVLCVKPVGVLSEDSADGACMPALLRQHYRARASPTTLPPSTGWTRPWAV